jgi:hypothetical protein
MNLPATAQAAVLKGLHARLLDADEDKDQAGGVFVFYAYA